MTRFARTLTLLLLGVAAVMPARANEEIFNQTLRSTVCVITPSKIGSGAVIDLDRRWVITNEHVVTGDEDVIVLFASFEGSRVIAERSHYTENIEQLGVPGRVIARDPGRDLAVIELESLPESAEALMLAEESPRPGQQVHSIGNPTVSEALFVYSGGTVATVVRRRIPFDDGTVVEARFVETEAQVNPGDSGGPVVNEFGQLVAVVQSHGGNANTMCLDVTEVRDFLENGPSTVVASDLSDAGLREQLEATGLIFNVEADGDFVLPFETDLGQIDVIARSVTETYEGMVIRHIWSPVLMTEGEVSDELLLQMLALGSSFKMGATRVEIDGNETIIYFSVRIPADMDPETLGTIVQFVAEASYGLREAVPAESPASHVDRRDEEPRRSPRAEDDRREDAEEEMTRREDRVDGRRRNNYTLEATGRQAAVAVEGDGTTDLDLWIFRVDADGSLTPVAVDERLDDRPSLQWRTSPGEVYLVSIVNYGEDANDYRIEADGRLTEEAFSVPFLD